MKYSLRTKLSISYALVAVLLVGAISVFTNIFLHSQFQQYVISQQESKNAQMANLVSQQVDATTQAWNVKSLENIGMNALEQGLILKVYDAKGAVVWDATVHNNGVCNQMLATMASNMQKNYPNAAAGYIEKTYPIKNGSVKVGYYGPFFLNDNDLAFINTFNQMLIIVGVISLLVALLLGFIIARRISDPIRKAILAAEKISRGDYRNRITSRSKTIELEKLISTINQLAIALESREQMQKRLTADVAHELRTPLATLQSHLEAMIDGVWEADKARLTGCHGEILRINRLVGDLEELAKYDGENLKLQKRSFDLKESVEKVVKNFAAEIKKSKVAVEVTGEAVTIFADEDKISQVIINLLSNAIKFSEKGNIRIKVEMRAGQAALSVTDTGIGIAEADLPFVFERFYRADASRNRATGGSGIGLAIVKGIVEAHGGTVSVESEEGKGTTF
ncbi:MAG: ATP-binding protein, partial [Clostridia bacterium]